MSNQPLSRNWVQNALLAKNMLAVDLQKSLDKLNVELRFTAQTNRMVVFGPSGAGKSLLLKFIAGFFDPDRGRIEVGDCLFYDDSISLHLPVHRRQVGYLPQEYTLFPNMTIEENIRYGPRVQKLKIEPDRFDWLVRRLQIESLLNRMPYQLSGGQQQRAALARILIIRPRILLLDEPFSALDAAIRENLRDLVIDLVEEMEIMALLVTHDLEEAYIFGSELVLIHQGRVVEHGEIDRLYHHPQTVAAARLMGIPNLFPVTGCSEGRVEIAGRHYFTCLEVFPQKPDYMAIRPEEVMIVRDDQDKGERSRRNSLTGVIEKLHHHGRYIKIGFRSTDGLFLQIHIPVHVYYKLTLEIGRRIQVFLKEESLIFCNDHQRSDTAC